MIPEKNNPHHPVHGKAEDEVEGGTHLQVTVNGTERNIPTLLAVSSFLYDFNLLYEFCRLAIDPRYEAYQFSSFSWNRNGRRMLQDADRLLVTRLRHESPLLVETVLGITVASLSAVIAVTTLIDWVSNRKLNTRKLEIEVEKGELELEEKRAARQSLTDENSIRKLLEQRDAIYYTGRTADRLRENPVQISEIEVKIVRLRLRQPDDKS